MINFDPIHYAAVGLGIVCIGLGIHNRILSAELDTERVTNQAIKVIGNVQNAHAKEEDQESEASKEEVENVYADIITGMHITNERLRDQIARSSKLPRTPQICTSASETTEVNWPDVDAAIREYRQEVRELINEGSESQAALNAIKMWVQKETRE